MPRCSHQFPNSSLICARCGSTLSQRGRMCGLNQASVSSLCRVWDLSVSLSSKGRTACIELRSQTTCRVLTGSLGIHPGSSFTSMARLFRRLDFTPEKIVVPHGDVWQLRKQGTRSFVQLPRFVASRVRARDDVARRCFLDGRDSRVSVSDSTVPKSVDDRGCPLTLLRPTYRQLLPQTEQFPACLRFGVCSSQCLVAHADRHLLIRSPLHVKMAARTPSLHLSRQLWQSRHELPSCCHQMLCHDAPAPKRATISNRDAYSFEWISDPSGFCCSSASCVSE